MPTTPDPTDPHPRGRVPVLDTEMSYASVGEGDPIVSRDFCRAWPNQDEVSVRGIHFIQEDNPNEIGAALAEFLRSALARYSTSRPQ